jgi:hypothetical protein
MENFAEKIHIGELIAISNVFELNTYQMLTLLESGMMEVFETREAFFKKYGEKETYDEIDWCELNNGKIFKKKK